jgi:hypothetical protein
MTYFHRSLLSTQKHHHVSKSVSTAAHTHCVYCGTVRVTRKLQWMVNIVNKIFEGKLTVIRWPD